MQPLLQSLRILKYQKETSGNKLTIKAFSLATDLSLFLYLLRVFISLCEQISTDMLFLENSQVVRGGWWGKRSPKISKTWRKKRNWWSDIRGFKNNTPSLVSCSFIKGQLSWFSALIMNGMHRIILTKIIFCMWWIKRIPTKKFT